MVESLLECEHVFRGKLRTTLSDASPEHPPKQLELGDDVPRREPERLALARVIADDRCERAAPVQPFRVRVREMRRELRNERRHVTELADGAARAVEALAPDEGDGASGLTAAAERAVAPLERLAPELARAGDELRDAELRLRETASELRAFLATLEAEPGRLEQVEADLDGIADAKRRFRADSYEELLARALQAKTELDAIDDGLDPVAAAAEALTAADEFT